MNTQTKDRQPEYSRLELRLRPSDDLDKVFVARPFLLGPYLQGVMMERLDKDFAARLHTRDINPYSLHCQLAPRRQDQEQQAENPEAPELLWRLSCCTKEAKEGILQPLLSDGFDSFTLKALGGHRFDVIQKTPVCHPNDYLTSAFHEQSASGRFRLKLLTPTAFKQQGRYVFTPDLPLILHSLSQKYNAIHDGDKEVDAEVMRAIVQSAHITSYRLQSEYFKIGQTHIPAFVGSIKFAVHSAQTIRNFVKMLLRCGELSGVGIKTAMGMGALSVDGY